MQQHTASGVIFFNLKDGAHQHADKRFSAIAGKDDGSICRMKAGGSSMKFRTGKITIERVIS